MILRESIFRNWLGVVLSIVLSSLFILAFLRPLKRRNWASLSITEAFLISLFTEMFGIPLTIYFLSGFFGIPLMPNSLHGHLLAAILALLGLWTIETGVLVVMVVSIIMLFIAAYLIIKGWRKLYYGKELVTTSVYAYMRHPQYFGILIGSIAFLIQWPTIPTLIMFPILVVAYYHLAKEEEKELVKKYGERYLKYQKEVPMLLPRLYKKRALLS
ncbi:MAG: NnrU family protein [Candidatus Bathyarchaeia archaeon]